MTVPYHRMSYDKNVSIDRNPSSIKTSPPVENVYRERNNTQGSSEAAGEARIQTNTGPKEKDGMDKTYQAEGVECDWQTVFWRLPTPQPSNNHIVPSSAETTIPIKTSAVGPQSSVSGLESHLAESAVTLGEKLAGEMIRGKNEDWRLPSLHLVYLFLRI
jgi:hypothetical protein